MKKNAQKYLLLFLTLGLLFTNCNNDDDIVPETEQEEERPEQPTATVEDYPVQDFMWQAMNFWYFWLDDVPNLADDKFDSLDDPAYVEFLASEDNPADFIENQLLFPEDRFTFYSDNYVELTQALSGISESNGMEFELFRYGDGNDVAGIVRYIAKGSDAETKDIERGEIFIGVNGENLFQDRNDSSNSNLFELLAGPNSSEYTLNMADIVDGEIVPNDKEVTLTKVANFAENPILVDTVLTVGSSKIAYLMYNQFLNEYDEELNEAFGKFVSEGATDLVLDLRYNPGGSVNSARLLSSMVYGTDTTDLFIRQRWNSRLQSLLSEEQLTDNFADRTPDGTAVNSMNLNRVYILATGSSASSSELVINGLAPYIDVVQIGETTTGKNEFSITFVDDPDSNFGPWIYNPERENEINPNNQWAIQPLVGRNENADGFFEYTQGLMPDVEFSEKLEDFGVLGSPDEPFLAEAIQLITGTSTAKRGLRNGTAVNAFTSSTMFSPVKDNMWLDKALNLKPDRK